MIIGCITWGNVLYQSCFKCILNFSEIQKGIENKTLLIYPSQSSKNQHCWCGWILWWYLSQLHSFLYTLTKFLVHLKHTVQVFMFLYYTQLLSNCMHLSKLPFSLQSYISLFLFTFYRYVLWLYTLAFSLCFNI